MKRIALTAAGVVTGHGVGLQRLGAALRLGASAVSMATRFDTAGLCSQLAVEAPVQTGPDRALGLLEVAARDAFGPTTFEPSTRRAVLLGSTKGSLAMVLSGERVDPMGHLTAWLAGRTHAQGPVRAIGAACASSSAAVGEAFELIGSGTCDQVVVAGVEALHPFVYAGFHSLKALSPHPAAPFDAQRLGLTLGEGAAVLLFESEAFAARQSVLAWVEGHGASSDGHDQTAPHPRGEGLLAACRRALARAGLEPSHVGRYHAHGTATLHNDRMEAAMCHSLFGPRGVPITAVKGSLGHTLGAAGALDVVACALSLLARELWPVSNLRQVDPSLEVAPVMGEPRAYANPLALVATAGFGGINTALLLRGGATR